MTLIYKMADKMKLKFIIKKQVARIISLFLPRRIMRDKRLFQLWEKRGYHVIPDHFYEPIPDTRELSESLWTKKSDMVGIDTNEKYQLDLLSRFSSDYKKEYDSFPVNKTAVPYQYYVYNNFFFSVDGEISYSMIRHFKPKKIIEIGSGFSTYLSAQAIRENEKDGYNCELISIEPYPNETLKAGFPGLSRVIDSKVQDIPLSEFNQLKENDILFIDSSHVLRIGGDVQYEFLEILPRLNKGVIVHIHDIFFPMEYPRWWVLEEYRFWTEQYLLQAFLTFNDRFEIIWAGNYMHMNHSDKLQKAFNSYRKEDRYSPASFWMRKIK